MSSFARLRTASASAPAPATSYERNLLGYTPDITPYQMVLDVLPAGALGIERLAEHGVQGREAGGHLIGASLGTVRAGPGAFFGRERNRDDIAGRLGE